MSRQLHGTGGAVAELLHMYAPVPLLRTMVNVHVPTESLRQLVQEAVLMLRGEPVVAGGYYRPDSWYTQKGRALAMIVPAAERGDFVRCPGLELFPLPLVPEAATEGCELPNWLPYMMEGLLNSIKAANKISALHVMCGLILLHCG